MWSGSRRACSGCCGIFKMKANQPQKNFNEKYVHLWWYDEECPSTPACQAFARVHTAVVVLGIASCVLPVYACPCVLRVGASRPELCFFFEIQQYTLLRTKHLVPGNSFCTHLYMWLLDERKEGEAEKSAKNLSYRIGRCVLLCVIHDTSSGTLSALHWYRSIS